MPKPTDRLSHLDQVASEMVQEIIKDLDEAYLDVSEELAFEITPVEAIDDDEVFQDAVDAIQKKLIARVAKALTNWVDNRSDDVVQHAFEKLGVRPG